MLLLALSAVFAMMRLTGDPMTLLVPIEASHEFVAEMRERLGFNRPLLVQYTSFIADAVRGDFGFSLHYVGTPALALVMDRIPNSLFLSFVAVLLAVGIGVPIGALSAVNANRIFDRAATVVSVVFQSIPNFWLGLMLVIFLSVNMGILPTSGTGSWKHVVLPAITLAAYSGARIQRLTRSSILEVLGADYIRTARAKGLLPRLVLNKHALKNAAIPIITTTALQFGHIFGSAIIVETIFSWPGVGRLILQSIEFRDFPVVLASVFFVAIVYILANLIADLLYALIDPQIRLS